MTNKNKKQNIWMVTNNLNVEQNKQYITTIGLKIFQSGSQLDV